MIYLIFLDIDGTILHRGEIHERTLRALSRAKACGYKVFINTGRALSIVPEKVTHDIRPDGLVCGLGAHIILDGRTIFSRTVDDKTVEKVMDFCAERSIRVMLEGENHSLSYGGSERLICPENQVFSFEDVKTRFSDVRVNKFTVMRPLTDEEKLLLGDSLEVFNHPNYSEIAIKGCTKASGVEVVARELGISRENTVAMGDSVNDLDILRAAGIAVAVGNATDEVKAVADFVSIPCSEGGVGYAVEKLILGEPSE